LNGIAKIPAHDDTSNNDNASDAKREGNVEQRDPGMPAERPMK
jgi:hypothetical protein